MLTNCINFVDGMTHTHKKVNNIVSAYHAATNNFKMILFVIYSLTIFTKHATVLACLQSKLWKLSVCHDAVGRMIISPSSSSPLQQKHNNSFTAITQVNLLASTPS